MISGVASSNPASEESSFLMVLSPYSKHTLLKQQLTLHCTNTDIDSTKSTHLAFCRVRNSNLSLQQQSLQLLLLQF